ncbi:ABC transporter ATP-binding protein [Cumulibacter soli]|uniref:ABC transporter ATP-binding protein n=1 Tax=Cumulibacter soli TaxID=2546344 RepID=UPI0010673E2C|nr:ATP-binding cassette domain-containing protein [Cumulibacter soli]
MGASVARLVDVHLVLGGEQVLRGLSLDLQQGSQTVVLGRSGAGKSTLLRVLDGELAPDAGAVELTSEHGDYRRAVVYQRPLLFDWLTVRQNVALGLGYRRNHGVDRARVDELLELLGIGDLRDRYPDQLSGGQAQRVSFGRALAVQPDLLLLDEPFSALDPATRSSLQEWIRVESRNEGLTSVIVTHDIDEALLLADEIVLLSDGAIERRWSVDKAQRDRQRAEIRDAFGVGDREQVLIDA